MARAVRVCVALGLLAAVGSVPLVSGDPPSDPAHGVNETTFPLLWSGDADGEAAVTTGENATSAYEELAAYTDVPFAEPPDDVTRWNRGEHAAFPETSHNTSIHPPTAELAHGAFLKDAYVDVFAISPSTRARLAPDERPLYVAPDGRVLATIDYRVATPSTRLDNETRTTWTVSDHHIDDTRLLVDDTLETSRAGSHTPTLGYDSLDEYDGTTHTLRVEADISVTLRRETETCTDGETASTCELEQSTVEFPVEQLTVSHTVDVSVQELTISGVRTRYPNGDLGIATFTSDPWRGFTIGESTVTGVWQFYSARDESWESLVWSTGDGDEIQHSPVHPLHVAAFPSATGPSATPRATSTLLDTYGIERNPPELPPDVALDVVARPYTASYGIVTRIDASDSTPDVLTSAGLVSGVETDNPVDSVYEVPTNESTLSLAVENATDEQVTVTVTLEDAETGVPINTTGELDSVVINGQPVNTDDEGTATLTMPRTAGGITARYEPGPWWRTSHAYVGDTDTVYVDGGAIALLQTLYRMAIPIVSILFAVYLLERTTGWRILRSRRP
ncbi:hypothetical protein SAMN06269185_2460 [Natronoarchaeum philippinense]|uniref:Uncharacterized protein n=2 Tax=Natronoarchaeum philippinense TaxID=558529 RepID=A0A285P2F4_NATPI|nr:hypothetical protein SAMN06269185_2460 [Natronoarchaeum philippinense]